MSFFEFFSSSEKKQKTKIKKRDDDDEKNFFSTHLQHGINLVDTLLSTWFFWIVVLDVVRHHTTTLHIKFFGC